MKADEPIEEAANVANARSSTNGKRAGRPRHGGRVTLSLTVPLEVRDALHARARRFGVSLAEYVANALAEPERAYDTPALRKAIPLHTVSLHLALMRRALQRDDFEALGANLADAHRVVAETLRPLRRSHVAEVRATDPRKAGGWRE